MKKPRWRVNDLIDLEYYLHIDESGGASERKAVAERDHRIYLDHLKQARTNVKSPSPGLLIRPWLDYRRAIDRTEAGGQAFSPGDVFLEIQRLLSWTLMILSFLLGSGLALSLLDYNGREPLNVALYLGALVFLQLALLFLLLLMFLLRSRSRSFLTSSVIYSALAGLVASLMAGLGNRALKKLTGSKRDGFNAVTGMIKGKKQIYGSLFYQPVFALTQIFGIGFNLGALASTLLKVLGSDIAFGWQSTVQFSASAVYNLARVLAWPWSWFIPPDMAYPSLSQVEGTRIILKEGIRHLATPNLVSWWPFLTLAVLFYGLLPRLVLYIAGALAQTRALSRVDFTHSACERLMYRLEKPVVSAGDRPVGDEMPDAGGDSGELSLRTGWAEAGSDKGLIALIPDEIFDLVTAEVLDETVFRALDFRVERRERIFSNEAENSRLLDKLSEETGQGRRPAVLILQEAWSPPIRENLLFIETLRKRLGPKARLVIGLIGRPSPETVFTPVKDDDWTAWARKLSALGDPYLRLERLSDDHG